MQEVFYEESARTQDEKSAKVKYTIFRILSIISYVLLVFWIIAVFSFWEFKGDVKAILINVVIVLIPCAIFTASGIILGRIKNKFYVDYDYTFVTGSVRISKVIANIKRRNVLNFEVRDIEKIGKYDSETFNKYYRTPGINKMVLTSNVSPEDKKDFFYLVVNSSNKYLLVLECTETFIVQILRFTGRSILEEDFK